MRKRILSMLWLVVSLFSVTSQAQQGFDCGLFEDQIMRAPNDVLEQLNALTLPSSPDDLACYYSVKGQAEDVLGFKADAIKSITLGLEALKDLPNSALEQQLLLTLSSLYDDRGESAKAREISAGVIDWAQQKDDMELLALALFTSGMQNKNANITLLAIEQLQLAYEITKNHQTKVPNAQIAFAIGTVLMRTPDKENALKYIDTALAFAKQQNITQAVLFSLQHKITILRDLGQEALAVEAIQELIERSQVVNDYNSVAGAYLDWAQIKMRNGAYEEANEFFTKALETFPAQDSDSLRFWNIKFLSARAKVELGNIESAKKLLDEAEKMLVDDPAMLGRYDSINKLRARIFANEGDYATAYQLHTELDQQIQQARENEQKQLLLEMQQGFEDSLREKENIQLREQNRLQEDIISKSKVLDKLYLSSISLLIFALSVLAFFAYKTRKHREELTQLVNVDTLTKVLSRRRINQLVGDILDNTNQAVTIALMDLDHFKRINDTFGHSSGDDVLIEFGSLANQFFAGKAEVGRVGGEEFLVFFADQQHDQVMQNLTEFSEQIHSIANKVNIDASTSVSIGVCSTAETRSFTKLLSHADHALYAAKEKGRDRIETFGA